MNQTSRIPVCPDYSRSGMYHWFLRLGQQGLLFHPDDSPEEIVRIDDGSRMFDDAEIQQLHGILDRFFAAHQSLIYDAAFESAKRAMKL